MYEEALKHLEEYDEQIVDRLALSEAKGLLIDGHSLLPLGHLFTIY